MYSVSPGTPSLFHVLALEAEGEQASSLLCLQYKGFEKKKKDLASLQDELVKAVAWCGRNVLTLNSKKTKVMIFSPNRQYPANQINIKIQKETVEIVPKFKYLGIIFDSRLSFQPHRADLIRRVQHKLYFLAKIRCYLTTYAALLIYKTTILPLLDYADYIYNPETKYAENKLQLLQNKALRIVYKVQLGRDRDTRSNELHSRANIIHLKDRRKQHLLHYAFDLAQNPGNRDMRPIRTRLHDGIRLLIPKPRQTIFYSSLRYRATQAWNSLDASITLMGGKLDFKSSIRRKK